MSENPYMFPVNTDYFDFSFTPTFLTEREIKEDTDDFVNCLQVLDIVSDTYQADFMRILCTGNPVTVEKVEEIFEYTFPQKKWKYKEIFEGELILYLDTIPKGKCCLCGFNKDGRLVSFLASKDMEGYVMIILCYGENYIRCNFTENNCGDIINSSDGIYYILC